MNAMSDVIQPAGAFLRRAQRLQVSDPAALVGSCIDIDEALRLRPDLDDGLSLKTQKQQQQPQFEPESFLAAMRRGLEEVDESDSDDDSDDDDDDDGSDDEGCYYQASKENTYYSPDQKLPGGFLMGFDDALDLSDTSTASSSQLTGWAQHELDLEDDDDDQQEDLIFQLDM